MVIRRLRRRVATPVRRPERSAADEAGFSIVETVVAITLMVFASAMAMQFLSSAAKATAHAHTTDQVASVSDGVVDAQAALGCSTATTPAMVAAASVACGSTVGDRTVSVTRDGHIYQVALKTSWVAVAGGSDQLRLRQIATVTSNDSLGLHSWPALTTEAPLGGTIVAKSGTGRVTVSATPGVQVAMIVGSVKLVHTVPADGAAVFPYLPVQPATSYFFQLVSGGPVKQVDLNSGIGGGVVAISLP